MCTVQMVHGTICIVHTLLHQVGISHYSTTPVILSDFILQVMRNDKSHACLNTQCFKPPITSTP